MLEYPLNCKAGKLSYSLLKSNGILSVCRDDVVTTPSRPAIFLDRDGVLNRRIVDGYVTRWAEFKVLPGVHAALRVLRSLEFLLIIVSNQAGVAKGLLSWEDLANITCKSLRVFGHSAIDAAFFCLHQPSDVCPCRKPKAGLLEAAATRLNIDVRRSFLVGDSPADIEAGQKMGCKTVYLGKADQVSLHASFRTTTLKQAAQWIAKQSPA